MRQYIDKTCTMEKVLGKKLLDQYQEKFLVPKKDLVSTMP